MFLKMLPCDLGVGCIAPFHMVKPRHCVAQVWNIEVPIFVMMGKVPHGLPFKRGFNYREGGIGKLPDVLPGPFRSIR
jgi:hypothetical protein